MLVSTFLNLAITPVLYVIIKSLELRGKPPHRNGAVAHASPDGAGNAQIATQV
jgi:hypothetical protein